MDHLRFALRCASAEALAQDSVPPVYRRSATCCGASCIGRTGRVGARAHRHAGVQCSAVQCSAMQCSAMWCSVVRRSAVRRRRRSEESLPVMLFEHIPQFVFPAALAAAPALRNLRNLLSFVHIQVRCARNAMQCNAMQCRTRPGGNVPCRTAACLPGLISVGALCAGLCDTSRRSSLRNRFLSHTPLLAFVHGNPHRAALCGSPSARVHARWLRCGGRCCARRACAVCVCSPQACRRATTRSSSCAPLAAPSTLTRHTCFSTPTLPSALTSAPYPWSPTLAPQVPSSVPGYQGRALRGLYAG